MANISNTSFLGQGWSFPPHFDAGNKALALVRDEEDIRQSLYILLHTEPGERIMNPDYGCPLRQFVFEDMTLSVLTRLQNVVKRAITRWEPRVTNVVVTPGTQRAADGVLLLEIAYTVSALNSQNNLVFPFYLRGTTQQP